MRTIQQKRQLPGNLALDRDVTGDWAGTTRAASPLDKDAAHCNKRLILFSLDFPARQGCRRPRSSRIPYPKRHERLPYQTRMLGLAPPKLKRRSIPSFGEGVSSPKGQDRQRMARSAHDA